MLGERSDQRGLWEADRLYLDHVGRDSLYGMLASLRGRLFQDADFAEFYCPDICHFVCGVGLGPGGLPWVLAVGCFPRGVAGAARDTDGWVNSDLLQPGQF